MNKRNDETGCRPLRWVNAWVQQVGDDNSHDNGPVFLDMVLDGGLDLSYHGIHIGYLDSGYFVSIGGGHQFLRQVKLIGKGVVFRLGGGLLLLLVKAISPGNPHIV